MEHPRQPSPVPVGRVLTRLPLPCQDSAMATYALFEIDWHDQKKAQEYREKFGPALDKYGGKTLCAGPPQVIEGNWNPARVVILEFPSTDAFRTWYASAEFAPVLKLRKEGATTKSVIVVEGPTR
jgi:uncharacterized protein (DUF1330 family)